MRRINCVFMVTKGGAGGQGGEREERDGFFIMIAAHVIVPLLGGRERCVSVRGKMKQKMPGMPLVKEADIVPYSSRQLSSRCCGGGSSVRSQEPRSDEERTGSRRDDTSLSLHSKRSHSHTHIHMHDKRCRLTDQTAAIESRERETSTIFFCFNSSPHACAADT